MYVISFQARFYIKPSLKVRIMMVLDPMADKEVKMIFKVIMAWTGFSY